MGKIRSPEAGQIVPLAATLAFAFVILLFGGVAVGETVAAKSQAQAAANAGALAGDTVLLQGGAWNQAQQAAYAAAEKNGYLQNAITASEVQTQGGASAVQVTVSGSVSFVLTMPVSATAEAAGRSTQPDPYALLTLGQSSCSALSNGTGDLTVNGGMFSDGGITMNGPGAIKADSIGIAGQSQQDNACTYNGPEPEPSPTTGLPTQPDPLAAWATAPSQPAAGHETTVRGTDTYYPGYYPNGIRENGSNKVVFEPGLYYLDGWGLTLNGSMKVSGSGVMFYLPPNGIGSLTVNGDVYANFSAPTTPLYTGAPAGVVVWNAGSSYDIINGGNAVQFNGTYYAPNVNLTANGSSIAKTLHGQVLVQSFLTNGNNDLTIGSSDSAWQATVSVPRLVTPGG